MTQLIFKSHTTAIRKDPEWSDKWDGTDKGLIISWEIGRRMAIKKPELAERARNGELPVLEWKGGVKKRLEKPIKYGCLNYLAMWQGLRGEDLNIDMGQEVEMTCTRTGQKVILTPDSNKYSPPDEEEDE